jgi:hypothetical protein
MTKKALSIFASLLLTASLVMADSAVKLMPLTPSFRMMQTTETKANGVAVRSNQPIPIEHYEIPLSLVQADISKTMSKDIYDSLVFERDGRKFIRWVINPEDTRWHLEIAAWLEANGEPVIKGQHFTGYQTASRSYIVRDPINGVQFSSKVSTNKTGGNWTDKKQTWEDAWQVRMAYQYVEDVIKERGGLKNSVWIAEPAAFGIEALDQGMLIRAYDSLADGKTTLIPGFAALHEDWGREIARQNGSNDPAKFWNDNYNKPLARALAEVYALTGMSYDSPHSQNFMIELDENNKPTGRIGLRDMGDSYMTEDIFEAAGKGDIPKRWELDNVLRGHLQVSAGLLHGNKDPSWMQTEPDGKIDSIINSLLNNRTADSSYNKWGKDFFTEFEAEFFKITGVDLAGVRMSRSGKYFSKSYSTENAAGKQYKQWIRDGRPQMSSMCIDVFGQAG